MIGLQAQPLETIHVNKLQLRLSSNGFVSDSASESALLGPNGFNLAKSCGVWLSAKDSSGKIRISAFDVLGNQHEFWPGPMSLVNEQSADINAWNKVYFMSKYEIDNHLNQYQTSNYIPSSFISAWPGSSGPPYAKILAPFVDNEVNDMNYNPKEGDYPYIVSDQVVYSLSNDGFGTHTLSNTEKLGIELHTNVMGFASEDSLLGNCLLVRYSVFNRSARDYKNFVFSGVVNFKIGAMLNEYLGTDVNSRAIFAINDTSEATFSNRLVSLGCMAINNKISSTIYFENTSDPVNGIPLIDSHFYRLSRGYWKNGESIKYGGNGVDASGSKARFVYPYETDASHGSQLWSDNDRYQPGQRIGIINFDSVELKRGKAMNFDLLYFFVDKKSFNIQQIGEYCSNIKQVLNTKNLSEIDEIGVLQSKSIELFPNPCKAGDKLGIKESLESSARLNLFDGLGRKIVELNLDSSENSIILPDDLKSGVYYLQIETLNTKRYTKVIINN
jgi:hypothetical protein